MTEYALRLSDLRRYCKTVPMFLQPWDVAGTAQVQYSGMVASAAFGPQVQRASVEIGVWNKGCLLARGPLREWRNVGEGRSCEDDKDGTCWLRAECFKCCASIVELCGNIRTINENPFLPMRW